MAKKEMGPKERQLREMREARQEAARATASERKAKKVEKVIEPAQTRAAETLAKAEAKAAARKPPARERPARKGPSSFEPKPSDRPTPVEIPAWQLEGGLEPKEEKKDKPDTGPKGKGK